MSLKMVDYNGHDVPSRGTALATGAAASTAVGTVIPVNAGAGTGSATANVTATDRGGSFDLTTGASGQAAGECAHVFFAKPYSSVPAAVICQVTNTTDGTTIAAAAGSVTVTGFGVVTASPTASKTYRVNYLVVV